MASPGRDIEIIIDQDDDLKKRFTTAPNALHRGERDIELNYDFRGMTLRGRALLAALASMQTGWKCNRRRIEALAPELGSKALDDVLWELRSRGHLRIVQENGTGGTFVYRWGVSVRGRVDWAEAEVAGRAERRRRTARVVSISAGQPMPPISGHGSDSDNSDETMGHSPDHGRPDHGEPEHGQPNHGSYPPGKKDLVVKEDLGEKDQTPPPPDVDAPPAGVEAEGGDGISEKQKQIAGYVLDDVIAGVAKVRQPKGAARAALLDLLAAELAAGWTEVDLGDALAGSFVGAGSVTAVLKSRIRSVGEPPPPPAPRAPAPPPGKPADDGLDAKLLAEGGDPATAKAFAAEQIAAALAKRKAS